MYTKKSQMKLWEKKENSQLSENWFLKMTRSFCTCPPPLLGESGPCPEAEARPHERGGFCSLAHAGGKGDVRVSTGMSSWAPRPGPPALSSRAQRETLRPANLQEGPGGGHRSGDKEVTGQSRGTQGCGPRQNKVPKESKAAST